LIKKVGIDLGTTNVLVHIPKKGIIINEPSVVAISRIDKKILAVGRDAKEMIGRTPDTIIAKRPLKDGVIADYYITKAMLKYFIAKAVGSFNLIRPDVVISAPAGITPTERRAIMNAAKEAGAGEAYIVKEPLLAALGAGIPINSYSGNMVINIGGGTSEVAVISLGGIVSWSSLRVAGNKFDQAIMEYIKRKYSLIIGEQTAEAVKMMVGSALPLPKPVEMKMRGRDLMTGLPREVAISDSEVREAIGRILKMMVENVRNTIENTPPELVSDIYERGMVMTGGGALLKNLDKLLANELAIAVQVVDDPLTAVVRGTGVVLEDIEGTRDLLLP